MGRRLLYGGLITAMTLYGCSKQNPLIPQERLLQERSAIPVVQQHKPDYWEVVGKVTEEEEITTFDTLSTTETGEPFLIRTTRHDDTDLILILRQERPKGIALKRFYVDTFEMYDAIDQGQIVDLEQLEGREDDPEILEVQTMQEIEGRLRPTNTKI